MQFTRTLSFTINRKRMHGALGYLSPPLLQTIYYTIRCVTVYSLDRGPVSYHELNKMSSAKS